LAHGRSTVKPKARGHAVSTNTGGSAPPPLDHVQDPGAGGHALGVEVVLLGGLQAAVAEQVGGDADLLWRQVDQLGHRAVAEQVRPDGLA
jgi:hypothetical protein